MSPARFIYTSDCTRKRNDDGCCGSCDGCNAAAAEYDDCMKCGEKLIGDYWNYGDYYSSICIPDRICYACYHEIAVNRVKQKDRITMIQTQINDFYEYIERFGKVPPCMYVCVDWDLVSREEGDDKQFHVPEHWKHWIPITFGRYKPMYVNTEWEIWSNPSEKIIEQAMRQKKEIELRAQKIVKS